MLIVDLTLKICFIYWLKNYIKIQTEETIEKNISTQQQEAQEQTWISSQKFK